MLGGCAASTTVETTGRGAGVTGAVQACVPPRPTLVLWAAQWRPDQKDIPARETAAWEGMQQYFIRLNCQTEIRAGSALPGDASAFARVVAVTVRELGPIVRITLPSILEGGTEVVVEIKVFDGRSGARLADLRTHWRHGGAFFVKGTGSLERDMTEALAATLK